MDKKFKRFKEAKQVAEFLHKQSAGITNTFHRNDLIAAAEALKIDPRSVYVNIVIPRFRVKRGHYNIKPILKMDNPEMDNPAAPQTKIKKKVVKTVVRNAPPKKTEQEKKVEAKLKLQAQGEVESIVYVPTVLDTYVKHGEFANVSKIVKSGRFFPIYIYGPSGNGKTLMVEQVCASLKREYLRVNLSPETCEDDLIGGWRLVDGNTVFEKGPVIKAMEAGAVLLLDEIDRATNKILCLQSVLEGRSILLKKTGETIFPADGFTVIVTANTAGRGSDDGKYSGASIIDDAFLERFPIAIEQAWPTTTIERKIILKSMESNDCVDDDFAEKLSVWTSIIRKTYEADGIDEVISTRRLDHIIQTYAVFKDRLKSIKMTITRFPLEVREAFVDLYTKIDEDTLTDEETTSPSPANNGHAPKDSKWSNSVW